MSDISFEVDYDAVTEVRCHRTPPERFKELADQFDAEITASDHRDHKWFSVQVANIEVIFHANY